MFLSGTKIETKSLSEDEVNKASQEENKIIQEASKLFSKTKELPPTPKFQARKRLNSSQQQGK